MRLADKKDKRLWLPCSLNIHLLSSYSALSMIQSVGNESEKKKNIQNYKNLCSHAVYIPVILGTINQPRKTY